MKWHTWKNRSQRSVGSRSWRQEWLEPLYKRVKRDRWCMWKGNQYSGLLDVWAKCPLNIWNAIKGFRDKWIIQGHIIHLQQNSQYERTRELDKVDEAFREIFLQECRRITLMRSMIHFVDSRMNLKINDKQFITYVRKLKGRNHPSHRNEHPQSYSGKNGSSSWRRSKWSCFSINPAFEPSTSKRKRWWLL